MPTYMKAYRLADLERYPRWQPAEQCATDSDAGSPTSESIVYLREDLAVVTGCFSGDSLLFQSASADWERFCRDELGFAVPDWDAESIRIRERRATTPLVPREPGAA